jgi:hypothetical protein
MPIDSRRESGNHNIKVTLICCKLVLQHFKGLVISVIPSPVYFEVLTAILLIDIVLLLWRNSC